MKRAVVVLAILAAVASIPVRAQSLEAQLQKAIQLETVTGDLRAAIAEYQRIAENAGQNRRVAAQALMRMAECHRKLGNAEATKILERVVREFGDQPDAAEARARLAVLRAADRRPATQTAQLVWNGADVDPMGAPSADGRLLSYTDWNTGNLGIRDLAAGQNRPLTNTGGWEASGDYAEFSVPSPDGREVAYAWFNDKLDSATAYELRVISISGVNAKPRTVYAPGQSRWVAPGAWTPDGKSIVFVREMPGRRFELAVVDVLTSALRILTPMTSPSQRVSVSPDGRFVAFDQFPAGQPSLRDVFVMAMAGGTPLPIVTGGASDQMPLWTPDGSGLLFHSTRTGSPGLWLLPMRDGRANGAPQMVKANVGQLYPLGLTRDGALLYYEGGARDNVYRASLDEAGQITGTPTTVSDQFVNANSSAAASRDGRFVAYYAYSAYGQASRTSLVIRDTRDGRERVLPLTTNVVRSSTPMLKWFPSGDALLVCGRLPEDTGAVYVRVDAATGQERALVSMTTKAALICSGDLSPDGRSIYIVDQERPDTPRPLKRFDIETGTTQLLLDGWVTSVAASPDGKHVAVLAAKENNARIRDLALLPVTGGAPRVLHQATWFDTSRYNTLGFSADGKRLYFVRSDADASQALWSIALEGGEPRKEAVTLVGRLKHPHVTSDGRTLFYTAREFGDDAIWTLQNFLPGVKRE